MSIRARKLSRQFTIFTIITSFVVSLTSMSLKTLNSMWHFSTAKSQAYFRMQSRSFGLVESNPIEDVSSFKQDLSKGYNELKLSGKLTSRLGGAKLDNIVDKYLPSGVSFKDAEALLRAAGFILHFPDVETGSTNPNRARDWYAVVASISPYESQALFRSDLFISILPRAPGDYSVVLQTSAAVYTFSP